MTILVTGGAGFVGSHLVERLLAQGKKISIVDNMTSSVWTLDDLEALRATAPFLYNTAHLKQMRAASSYPELESVYHLASPVGPAGILQHAGDIISQIVGTTYDAIDVALGHKCRLVYVSTSEVYGGGQNGLCSEDMPCVVDINNPTVRLEYAIGKLAGEIAVMNTPRLDAVIVRPFNISGARQSSKGGFVLPRFVQQVLANESLTVFGDGQQVRAFTHVSDIVDGLLLAMEKGKSGRVYNLGNPDNKVTIDTLAQLVMSQCKQLGIPNPPSVFHYMDGKTIYGPAYAEANDKYPDATRAIQELGWAPRRTIDEIVRDVIEYERERINVD